MLLRNESILNFGVDINLYYDDDTEKHLKLNIGDLLEVTYNYNGTKSNIKGRLIDIKPLFRSPVVKDYKADCFCHYNDNPIAQLEMDISTKLNSEIRLVNIDDIIDLNIVETFKTLECLTKDLSDTLLNASAGDVIKISGGFIDEDLTISTPNVTLVGENTIMANKVIVTAPGVVLKNITFVIENEMIDKIIDVQNVEDFSMIDCEIYVEDSVYNNNPISIKAENITIEKCLFNIRENKLGNVIETSTSTTADVPIRTFNFNNNIFIGQANINIIKLYYFVDGATVEFNNNTFEYVNNALYISNVTSAAVTFNIDSNNYNATSEDSEYNGFIGFNDYSTDDSVQDFTKITLNISRLKGPEGKYIYKNETGTINQVYYVVDAQDGQLKLTNQPKANFIN